MRLTSLKYNLVIIALVFAFVISPLAPFVSQKAQAQLNPAAVPTDCGISMGCIMKHWKDFIGDKLAVMVANQLIQRMTASIVTWINRGFQGSPAFLTNPEGFFLDVGDQITGEFLEKTGTQVLCTPFSYDLRLNIALNRAQGDSFNRRYTCTLGTIIQNNKNAIDRSVASAGIIATDDPNGATLGDFMNGNFSQGGWEGFLAYTTQAQNNPIGAYLLADSDIKQQIAEKKAAYDKDLNRGQGFLSWPKCTDVTANYTDPSLGGESLGLTSAQENQLKSFNNRTLSTGQTRLGQNTNIKKITDASGTRYQKCEIQTPGSAIASSLFDTLRIPSQKLVLVKTISDSIDAITGALVNQMLTQGLAALSGNGSGVGGSSRAYLTQLSEESYNSSSYDSRSAMARSTSSTNSLVNLARESIAAYDRALSSLGDSRNKYVSARACFSTKLAQLQNNVQYDQQKTFGERMIQGIDIVITRSIDPLIASTTERRTAAQNALNGYQNNTSSAITGDTIRNDISEAFSRIDNSVDSATNAAISGIQNSGDVLQQSQNTEKTITSLNKDAGTFQSICNQYPGYSYQFQRFEFENALLRGFP